MRATIESANGWQARHLNKGISWPQSYPANRIKILLNFFTVLLTKVFIRVLKREDMKSVRSSLIVVLMLFLLGCDEYDFIVSQGSANYPVSIGPRIPANYPGSVGLVMPSFYMVSGILPYFPHVITLSGLDGNTAIEVYQDNQWGAGSAPLCFNYGSGTLKCYMNGILFPTPKSTRLWIMVINLGPTPQEFNINVKMSLI